MLSNETSVKPFLGKLDLYLGRTVLLEMAAMNCPTCDEPRNGSVKIDTATSVIVV
jgi:hypothetical protein